MTDRVVRVRIWLVLLLVCVGALIWLFLGVGAGEAGAHTKENSLLKVHFLDVGQGDATLIETPDGVQVLIDGGRDSAVLRQLGNEMNFFDRYIDIMIATHPDSDHIGGLIDVLQRYEIGTIFLTDNTGDSPTAQAFLDAVTATDAEVIKVRAGQRLTLGASTTLDFLFPVSDAKELETNTASIINRLTYGESDFLFTGDAPKSIEEYLVTQYESRLQSEILKVGHHGSKTSTAKTFVFAVAPDLAVISAAKNNPYGHPHQEVLDALDGIEVVGTYELGTITVLSDGKSEWVE